MLGALSRCLAQSLEFVSALNYSGPDAHLMAFEVCLL